MANTVPFYRMYLNEKLRKILGINLRNKKTYIFKLNHTTYLSLFALPTTGDCIQLTNRLGNRAWFINIPVTMVEYEPVGYKVLNTNCTIIELLSE